MQEIIIWRICEQGHRYRKSSDCPVCPKCAEASQPQERLLSKLSAPACRALQRHGVHTVRDLAAYSLKEVLSWHGVGKASIPVFKSALETEGFAFKE